MKILPSGMQTHLDTKQTTLCWCWLLTRVDGTKYGFTDHDNNLTFGGSTFEASSGFSASEIEDQIGLAVSNLDVQGALDSARLNEDDLAAGFFDNASVEIYRVNWSDTSQRILMRKGSLGEVRRGEKLFTAEVRGLSHNLQQPKGRVFQYTCDAVLGDARCGIDLNSGTYTRFGGVANTILQNRFDAAGLNMFSDDFFGSGKLTWMSGNNSGQSMEVKLHTRLNSNFAVNNSPIAFVFSDDLYRINGSSVNFSDVFTFSRASECYAEDRRGFLTKFTSGNKGKTSRGIHLFSQSTNAINYSYDLSNAWWDKRSGITISSNSVVAPNGNTEGDTITKTASSYRYVRRQSLTASSSSKYTFSAFVKSGTLTKFSLVMQSKAGSTINDDVRRVFDLNTKTVTVDIAGNNFVNAQIDDYYDGWKRIQMTIETGSSDDNLNVFLYPDDLRDSNSGNCYCWGAQLENKSRATSYIETNGSSATRQADQLTLNVPISGFTPNLGTFFARWYQADNHAENVRTIVHWNQASLSRLRSGAVGYLQLHDSSSNLVVNNGYNSAVPSGFHQIAARVKADDFGIAYSLNSAEIKGISSDNSGTPDSANPSAFHFGGVSGSESLDGYLSDFYWFATGETDSSLQNLVNYGVSDTQIELWQNMPSAIAQGDQFEIAAGCDKNFNTCKDKFNNFVNYRGFPHMPGNDFVTSYPNSDDTDLDGGSIFN